METPFFAKKSLGQHFLSGTSYLKKIAEAADISPNETILEIGPGKGSLTAELLSRGARIVAVEKDARLIPFLQEKFAEEIGNKKLELIEEDVLEFSPAKIIKKEPYKLVANIPYYLTGAIIRKFLSEAAKPTIMILLVQKEVAVRIARDKKESLLSLSVKAYGAPRYISTVPRGAFAPAPSVDSAILAIDNISSENFANSREESYFFELLHAGFAHKRKLLMRNLESILGENTEQLLKQAKIPEKARAEDVSLTEWLTLAKMKH